MQIPVVWIGVLLSINRFIRIAFNGVVIKLFARYGIRTITITASAMAILSTMGYGLGWGLFSLIIFRIIWGLAYAMLRISSLAYALEHEYIGISLGLGKSVQEVGPLLALWFGPVLLSYLSPFNTFFLLGMMSLPSILYAASLPVLSYIPVEKKSIFNVPSLFNLLTFSSSFIVDGTLIIVTGQLLSQHNGRLTGIAITSMVAGYLAYRRICYVLFSPLSGLIAGRAGFIKIYNFSLLMIITGLLFLIFGWILPGLIIVLTFNSINNTMAPGAAANGKEDKIRAVAINASWQDMGAATGALTGGLLLAGNFIPETFTIVTFILALLFFIHLRKSRKS
jgi:DHA1 family multidrug resistance protein-like MFS transporter